MIDPNLLEILACPVCASRPPLRESGDFLICTLMGHGYKVVDGIPHLLPEDVIEKEKLGETS